MQLNLLLSAKFWVIVQEGALKFGSYGIWQIVKKKKNSDIVIYETEMFAADTKCRDPENRVCRCLPLANKEYIVMFRE